MKIIILEKGFHGIEPMMVLLEEGQITNVQFLLHSENEIKDEYESYCKTLHADPYEEDIATKYLAPWMDAWKKKTAAQSVNNL